MTHARTYSRTHSHISFSIDLRDAPRDFWMLLGEAQSKIEHVAGVPLRPDVAAKLHQIYLAKGALATTAIEGNTLTEDEVRLRVEGRLELPPSREYLGKEIDNIVRAANDIFKSLMDGKSCDLSFEEILAFNAQVLDGLELEDKVVPGRVRNYDVSVGGYHGAPPQECEYLLKRLCDWLNGPDFHAPQGQEIAFGILKAIVAHLYIAWIHPFGDGNGRTARLVEFKIMAASGVPLPSAHLLSDHYNLTRSQYYHQLKISSRDRDGAIRFLYYAIRGFVDTLKQQVAEIRNLQIDYAWLNYVHETLGHKSVTEDRRRHIVLDLSSSAKAVPLSELTNVSSRVIRDYAAVSDRTLARDIKELVDRGYIVRTKEGFVANKNLMASFLAARHCPI